MSKGIASSIQITSCRKTSRRNKAIKRRLHDPSIKKARARIWGILYTHILKDNRQRNGPRQLSSVWCSVCPIVLYFRKRPSHTHSQRGAGGWCARKSYKCRPTTMAIYISLCVRLVSYIQHWCSRESRRASAERVELENKSIKIPAHGGAHKGASVRAAHRDILHIRILYILSIRVKALAYISSLCLSLLCTGGI